MECPIDAPLNFACDRFAAKEIDENYGSGSGLEGYDPEQQGEDAASESAGNADTAAPIEASIAAAAGFKCAQNAVIRGKPDIFLSNGQYYTLGYTYEQCQQECVDEQRCRSVVFTKSDGYCELWTTQDRSELASDGSMHCWKAGRCMRSPISL